MQSIKFRYNLLIVIAVLSCMSIFSQDEVILTFNDNFNKSSDSNIKLPMLAKAERLSRHTTHIGYGSDIEDLNVRKCIEYSINIWESVVWGLDSIYIEFKIGNNESDIKTTVRYRNEGGSYMPTSLYYSNYNHLARDIREFDGTIYINPNSDWDYSVGDNISTDQINLTYALMRAIARILGFGSSISLDSDGQYSFSCKRGYSLFDNIIVRSDSEKLISIPAMGGKTNTQLKNFIENTSCTFSIITPEQNFKFAAPPYSWNNPPLTFIEMDNCLMGSSSSNNCFLRVDPSTKTILETIGWELEPEETLTILSDDVSENGIASAYKDLKFYVNNIGSIRNSKWILIRPMKDGTMKQTILSENSLECTIPAIDNENLYRININGDIDCKLQFECDLDNQHVEAAPFSLHLELRPYIETARISKIEQRNGKPAYDAFFTVQYRGSEKIRVSVEEEFGSGINTQIINEPFIVNGVVENITSPYYAWIDFFTENEYGSSLYTIELGPYGEILNSENPKSRDAKQTGASFVNPLNIREYEYRVFNVFGNNMGTFYDIDEFYKNANGGMYIIKQFIGNKCVNTKKVVIN